MQRHKESIPSYFLPLLCFAEIGTIKQLLIPDYSFLIIPICPALNSGVIKNEKK